jgi:type I restriction enzyme R subunit
LYKETDFNKIIEIKEREAKRVQIFLDAVNQNEKAIVFCATQEHAAAVRDLINQKKQSKNPKYCVRVTANDGELGDEELRNFQDNEKTIPTMLTTSQKLSTGVNARNIRNIILMRPIHSMIEFKQIIGRGTRLFEGKEFFTIYDFVDAYQHFADPEWDGPPEDPEPPLPPKPEPEPIPPGEPEPEPPPRPKKIKVKLADGKEREIHHMMATSFWSEDGVPISANEFLQKLFGKLPEFFNSEDELREIWKSPATRRALLEKLAEAGYGKEELTTLQSLINAEKSDLFDVLQYVFDSDKKPITREARVAEAQSAIFADLSNQQKEFLEFVLSKYIESGVEELGEEQLPKLLTLKYHALNDAKAVLGDVPGIRSLFINFQKHLYDPNVAHLYGASGH